MCNCKKNSSKEVKKEILKHKNNIRKALEKLNKRMKD